MGQYLDLPEQAERHAVAHLREMDGHPAGRSADTLGRGVPSSLRERERRRRGEDPRVAYVLQFGAVFASFPALLAGALLTIELSAGAMVLGLALAVACAFARN